MGVEVGVSLVVGCAGGVFLEVSSVFLVVQNYRSLHNSQVEVNVCSAFEGVGV